MVKLKMIVCTACHKYKLNSAGLQIYNLYHNGSWQAVPRVVVIGYGELLTSELLPAFVLAKMARCLKLNV